MPPKPAKKKKVTISEDRQYASARDEQLKALSRIIADTAPLPLKAKVQWLVQASLTLTLAAIFTTASHLSLSPVYGEVPSSLYHSQLVSVLFLLGWVLQTPARAWGAMDKIIFGLPLLAAWSPVAQFFLFGFDTQLGPLLGPFVTEVVSLSPLLLASICVAASPVQLVQIPSSESLTSASHAGLGAVIFSVFNLVQSQFRSWILAYIGKSVVLSRVALQYVVAVLYAVLFPSKLVLIAIPSLLHALLFNTHLPLPYSNSLLQTSLEAHSDYTLLARQDSLTGYISVLENRKDNFRVLRCDHSLLGGEWIKPPAGYEHTTKSREPVYGIFTMTEAVRLVERDRSSKSQENCLIIGLGIGTSATAMIAHGIDTTIVEIDPIVHRYALEYFSLPSNHTAVIDDATRFVQKSKKVIKYDYIIHDVFTGGAEPAELFTKEFLSGLRDLLKPDGVLAIIYAGDITLQPARLVMHTIRSVFSNYRIFREDDESIPSADGDFTNLAIFCSMSASPLTFRDAVEGDFLDSLSRRTYLVPKHEVPKSTFAIQSSDGAGIIRQSNINILKEGQQQSALGHWRIMRTVMPEYVWRNW